MEPTPEKHPRLNEKQSVEIEAVRDEVRNKLETVACQTLPDRTWVEIKG